MVRYTSEELRQMKSQTDWDVANAMTDEEIEAAIAADPEETAMHERWTAWLLARKTKANES